MSKQRIEMTDTGTFSELQKVYGDFNNDLNDFINKIKPLTDITDALYTLRKMVKLVLSFKNSTR